jgi:NAD(P)-dependent dehydrogenase (short-subunit alcohol dehydrogenase family)
VFTKVMETNVRSNLWLANLVHPEMAARRDGNIIIVSSIGGLKGTEILGIYAISKAADMQLARNLAVEWGPSNIRVNCIAPGLVRTDFARALWEDPVLRKGSEDRTALRRIGDPEDISGAAVFLASRAGRWITGQAIVIDGGRTIF